METPIRHIRMQDELWSALERIAKAEDRTAGWLVRKAAEEYIDRYRAAKRAEKQASEVDLDSSEEKRQAQVTTRKPSK